ncbi:MAG: hypothetical protein V2J11_03135 [Desulfofustis sp.]|jgi:hypothetical protein|nr:hypothetical protein [Desulfofustis sp.]
MMVTENRIPVFSIDGRAISDVDLLECRGLFPDLQTAIQRASAVSEAPDAGALQEYINNFRYQHELISREDLDEWLEARKISPEEFLEAMSSLQVAESTDDIDMCETLDPSQSRVLCWCIRELESACKQAHRWLLFSDKAFLQDGDLFDLLKEGSLRYEAWLAAEITKKDLEALLNNRMLDFTKVDLTTLMTDSEQVAREARLCWQEGLWQPEDFQKLAPVALGHECSRMRDLDPVFRTQLLARMPGDVLAPAETEEGWTVVGLTSRHPPTLGDSEVYDELKELLVRPRLEKLSKDRILWHLRS